MALLNPELFAILTNLLGEGKVVKEGSLVEFAIIPVKNNAYKCQRAIIKYADVSDWGETYNFCCPNCKDTRHRLSFCHMWGQTASVKNDKGAIEFGKHLWKCHNEDCQRKGGLDELKKQILDSFAGLPVDTSARRSIDASAKTFKKYVLKEHDLPKGCIPITSDNCAGVVHSYLDYRQFDPLELYEKYYVMYAPAGSTYMDGPLERQFREDRMVIPIVQSTKVVSWQARQLFDAPHQKQKYLFPPGCRKSTYLYNMDQALFHRDMVIVEGVTDVWRIGECATAIFGKSMSSDQLEIIRCLWDYEASCVVIPDGDDDKALEAWDRIAKVLRMSKIFKYGVGVCMLEKGKDPANYTRDEIMSLISNTVRTK